MTPNAPTWADIQKFLKADGWRRLASGEAGGSQADHVFYEKVLSDGTVLKTHISHSSRKSTSAGRFRAILRTQIKVTAQDFWECVRTGSAVDRLAPAEPEPELAHEAWVVNLLKTKLHMSDEAILALTPAEALMLVQEKIWGAPDQ